MREIKFRAWHINAKEFTFITFDISDYRMGWIIEHDGSRDYSHFKFTQFIGLKDRDGNDIYEGDIIGFDAFDYDERKDYIDYYVVYFGKMMDERYGYFLRNNSTQKIFYDEFSKGVVRGNIYETPELLSK